jgi:hypothetical protein
MVSMRSAAPVLKITECFRRSVLPSPKNKPWLTRLKWEFPSSFVSSGLGFSPPECCASSDVNKIFFAPPGEIMNWNLFSPWIAIEKGYPLY